ncbi:unnamed protein product [Phytophthora lilii]|uniref:Unnamed protein product n=1 Tax=Phytophthora lilii TaxID=2077276 RepID=A0A9W6TNF5_9STRA|nr:unnamed protein product [Phytophthora lilii]
MGLVRNDFLWLEAAPSAAEPLLALAGSDGSSSHDELLEKAAWGELAGCAGAGVSKKQRPQRDHFGGYMLVGYCDKLQGILEPGLDSRLERTKEGEPVALMYSGLLLP